MGENEERWKDLCAQAAQEQDPVKLQLLVQEINRLLEGKRTRLEVNRLSSDARSS